MRYRSTQPSPVPRSALAIAAREALAFARQGLLLRHDAAEPIIPAGVAPGDDVVVFLHGLFATAGVLRPLRAVVARHRFLHTGALTYLPGPGVPAIAERLRALASAIPAHARLHLVGHSLGGIVARWFALESGDARIVQTISLAAPFGGVPRAAWLGVDTGRDLHPRSAVLRRILLHPDAGRIPHLSIIAGADTLVPAPISHALPGGDVLVMAGRGHNTLLFDDEVARAVERRILAPPGPPGLTPDLWPRLARVALAWHADDSLTFPRPGGARGLAPRGGRVQPRPQDRHRAVQRSTRTARRGGPRLPTRCAAPACAWPRTLARTPARTPSGGASGAASRCPAAA